MRIATTSFFAILALTLGACGDDGLNAIPNHAPKAVAGLNQSLQAGMAITFDGSESSDPDGDELSFLWDLGDGNEAAGSVVTHTFAAPGTFTVTLTVEDPLGESDSDDVEITVTVNEPPVAVINAPSSALVGDSVSFDGSSSTDSDGHIELFTWDFGGGAVGAGATADHVFDLAGTFTVKLAVTDNGGATHIAEHVITVEDPVVDFSGRWTWTLVDESQRDLGFTCGEFYDSTLTIDTSAAPTMTITEQAGIFSATYSGTLATDNTFATTYTSISMEQKIEGTFTSATTFEGVYKVAPLSASCEDRAVTGVKTQP